MDTSGFYKNENGTLLYGRNFVINAEYELHRNNKGDHQYPIDGWYWFDTKEDAYAFWGLEKPTVE